MLPVIARNLLESIRLLAAVSRAARRPLRRRHRGRRGDVPAPTPLSSPSLATALNPVIGYEAAAQVVKQAVAEGRTVREVVLDEGCWTPPTSTRCSTSSP